MTPTRILCLAVFSNDGNKFMSKLVRDHCTDPCRVPFGKVTDRSAADTLPYHMTLTSGKLSHADAFLEALPRAIPERCSAALNGVQHVGGFLYLTFTPNASLANIQRKMFRLLPENKNCQPDRIQYHVTLDISNDVEKARYEHLRIQRYLSLFPRLPVFSIPEIRMYTAWPPSPEPVTSIRLPE